MSESQIEAILVLIFILQILVSLVRSKYPTYRLHKYRVYFFPLMDHIWASQRKKEKFSFVICFFICFSGEGQGIGLDGVIFLYTLYSTTVSPVRRVWGGRNPVCLLCITSLGVAS